MILYQEVRDGVDAVIDFFLKLCGSKQVSSVDVSKSV